MPITKQFKTFCYDWMIGYVPKHQLIKEFNSYRWDFYKFRETAQKNTYWVPSMKVLMGK